MAVPLETAQRIVATFEREIDLKKLSGYVWRFLPNLRRES